MGIVDMPQLKQGDTVALIAPVRAVSREEMAPFISWCKDLGWNVKEGKHLYGRFHQFSGTDEERASDFIEAWQDPEVKLVMCARGGYGSMRWLHLVPETAWMPPSPRIFAGYSDPTTLHLELNRRGFQTLHSPMAHSLLKHGGETIENFKALQSFLETGEIAYDLSKEPQFQCWRGNAMEGIMTGGNLSLIYASLGTPEQPETRGRILFLEDLDEYLYHIDRMLWSLRRAGIFEGLSGLIIGDMGEMRDNAIPFGFDVESMVKTAVADYTFPVIFGFPAGHGPKNVCFKLNAYTTFDGRFFKQHSN